MAREVAMSQKLKPNRAIALLLTLTLTLSFLFTLPLLAETLADGPYLVAGAITGGSGRASIESPVQLSVQNGQITARLVWSSSNYTWMEIAGKRYEALPGEEFSTFEVPVSLDQDLPFKAETVAMSKPHVVDYTLHLEADTLEKASPDAQEQGTSRSGSSGKQAASPKDREDGGLTEEALDKLYAPASLGNGWKAEGKLDLTYAQHFRVDYFQEGYALIRTTDGSRYLLIPQGKPIPDKLDEDVQLIPLPLQQVYMAATGSMGYFAALEAMDSLGYSSLQAQDWFVDPARQAMEEGSLAYGGKYSEPNYELLLAGGCKLTIESLMISHAPEVKEKLEDLAITVFVDLSSQEAHPLARTEWIRCYGTMLGKDQEAQAFMDQQIKLTQQAEAQAAKALADRGQEAKTVAFFYINSKGNAVTRKSSDYLAKMIELAGGHYIFDNLGKSSQNMSSVNMEMEKFYATARDADIIIYNSAITGELQNIDDLLALNPLLAEFKAVQHGEVWCTDRNLYQSASQHGQIIRELSIIICGPDANSSTDGDLDYFFKLK